MLLCQCGLKSLRNVPSTLLDLCHKELRQLRRIQPSKKQGPTQQGSRNIIAFKAHTVWLITLAFLCASFADDHNLDNYIWGV